MDHNHSKPTCPTVNESGPSIKALVASLTFHKLSIIVSGATAAFSCLIAVFLIFRHATHFSVPAEQKQIIRIITIIPSFALVSLLCVWLNSSPAPYILPALDVGEAFPMAAFYLLMSSYVVPDGGDQESFFIELELIDKRGNPQGQGSLRWYQVALSHRLTLQVAQWIPVSFLMWIATVIALAVGTYCATSNKPHFAHIWITIIRIISTGMAIISILHFYKRFKNVLKPRGAFKQLICFKIIVFLNFLQTFVFNFLRSSGHLHANNYLTFNDLSNGIPALLLSCEITIIAPLFLVAYSAKQYTIQTSVEEEHSPLGYQGGPFGIHAILSAANIIDIISTLAQGIKSRGSGSRLSLGMQNRMDRTTEGGEQYQGSPVGRRQRGDRHSMRY